MLNALLLPLLLAAAPAGQNDDPAVQLWINNDRRFVPGDQARVHVRARDDGYLVVLHSDADGNLRVLFPLDPADDNFVRGGKRYEIHDRGGREAFRADRTGRGTVYAAVSRAPFRYEGYVLGDHWDYRTLAPERLPRDPENELTDLIRRMAGGSFDYDVLTYDVLERVVYASDYSYSRSYPSAYYYDDPWCGSYWNRCGGGLSIGITFGRPYRYGYYSPHWYGYDPYYDPFFYDPYYYRPAYYYPYRYHYYPYRSYYYPRYRDHWRYDHRYTNYGRPYTPYRFRGSLASNDLRGRDYGFRRAVNTVYAPPVTRLAESERATPIRRVTREAATDRIEPRRETGQREPGTAERREPSSRRTPTARSDAPAERGNIEARRAREREPEQGGTMRDARDYRGSDRPEEVRGRRAEGDDRPNIERAPTRTERPDLPEARPVRRSDDRPNDARPEPRAEPRAEPQRESRPEPRAEPRYEPRAEPRSAPRDNGGGGRVERSSPPPAAPSHDGGRRSGGGGDGGGGGGGRRR